MQDEDTQEVKRERSLVKLASLWAALLVMVVSALIWAGEQNRQNENFKEHLVDAKAAMDRFEKVNVEVQLTKQRYDEILRRLERIEVKLEKRGF